MINTTALRRSFLLLSLCSLGAGCATNGLSIVPQPSQVNVSTTSKLQFAVGTAYFAATGSTGLNTVATFRQSNGLSATLVNTPTITGPSSFVVPAPNPQMTPWTFNVNDPGEGVNSGMGPGTDTGTNSITGLVQSYSPVKTGDTFNMSGGVFSSGFGPFNADASGAAYMPGSPDNLGPGWPTYPLPFYSPYWNASGTPSGDANCFLIGPPAVNYFKDGSFPAAFAGYPSGFTPFGVKPVTGTYQLQVQVPAGNASGSSFNASAQMSSVVPIPALSLPSIVEDGKGGATLKVTVPADPRIVETMLFISDQTTHLYYAIGPVKGTGTLTFTLPDLLGTCSITTLGCENGANAGPSFNTGDALTAQAVTFDYPQFEAEPPGNVEQTPVITGSNGQADLSISPELMRNY